MRNLTVKVTTLVLCLAGLLANTNRARPETAWSGWFEKPVRRAVPPVSVANWLRNPVDAFVLAELEGESLTPAPAASPRVLARRLYFDLVGFPPTPVELQEHLDNPAPDAYPQLVDRLLADPRYAERWARHWLDVVGFGETDGLEDDIIIGNLWRYRDWVIDALDRDMPYDRFVTMQIAGGDEVHPTKAWHQPDIQDYIPAGFLRLAPWDLGNLQAYELRQAYLDEVTGVTASVFLGLTLECARCHDHKYDDIPARDYYRFQAFFNAIQVPLPPNTSSKAPEFVNVPYADEGIRRRAELRITSYEKRLEEEDLKDDEAALLRRRIARWETNVATVRNVAGPPLGPDIAPIRLLLGGDLRNRGETLEPGFPSLLTGHSQPAKLETDRYGQYPTRGRRTTLARWIASPDNPLTARVMVNRIWEYHFGRGIVETPNNFGFTDHSPTHPELLDWLAVDFVAHDWSLKSMHRRLVTSATYGQASDNSAVDDSLDPENSLLWRFRRRRLEAEAIRDSLLAISGRLSLLRYGPGVFPSLPPGLDELRKPVRQYSAAWDSNETAEDTCRRSIYTFQQRSLPSPLMASFDAQVVNKSCPRRSVTTTPLQALSMMNGTLVSQSAAALARRIEREAGPDNRDQIVRLFELVFSRPPLPDELERFLSFDGSLTRLARVMLSSNEFLYVD
ncbi:MAG: hypothetical protein CMJ81_16630 [Planctomycetaceae bacterium]|nr:hypothetical protein [Planctomycetaceae bacterium]